MARNSKNQGRHQWNRNKTQRTNKCKDRWLFEKTDEVGKLFVQLSKRKKTQLADSEIDKETLQQTLKEFRILEGNMLKTCTPLSWKTRIMDEFLDWTKPPKLNQE